jgi:hypothetical protein
MENKKLEILKEEYEDKACFRCWILICDFEERKMEELGNYDTSGNYSILIEGKQQLNKKD